MLDGGITIEAVFALFTVGCFITKLPEFNIKRITSSIRQLLYGGRPETVNVNEERKTVIKKHRYDCVTNFMSRQWCTNAAVASNPYGDWGI